MYYIYVHEHIKGVRGRLSIWLVGAREQEHVTEHMRHQSVCACVCTSRSCVCVFVCVCV